MTVFPWLDLLRHDGARGRGYNATIGVFDGLHLGHRTLIDQLQVCDNLAFPDAGSLVVTFRTSPKKVLQPGYPGDLMTWEQKLSHLESLGVEVVVAIDFSTEFGKMSGRDFFYVLKKTFVFSKLVLGWNFSFGSGSGTTASDLGWMAEPQTRLTVVPPLVFDGGPVSSSRIRQCIREGQVFRANQLLGREYSLPLSGEPRVSRGRASLERSEFATLVPGPGSYLCRLGERTTTVLVTGVDLTWESPPGERLKEIVFVQGVQNGIE